MQMMSLQVFDRTYPVKFPSNLGLSPLLSCEALRRLAWSTFYADTLLDGGRYGFHVVDEKSYRLQLPCDNVSFLSNETVVTEPLHHNPKNIGHQTPDNLQRAPLDMLAYLLRTAALRRRILHLAFRASHQEGTVEEMNSELLATEVDSEVFINALPRKFHFTTDNMFIHRERLISFLLLHVLRHNLFIILGRAALLIYQRDHTKADLISQVRQKRIARALPIAALINEGLKAGVRFDVHMGIQAYVVLESMYTFISAVYFTKLKHGSPLV